MRLSSQQLLGTFPGMVHLQVTLCDEIERCCTAILWTRGSANA
jgi:hypothetical protein